MDEQLQLRQRVERLELVIKQLLETLQALSHDLLDEPDDVAWYQERLERLHALLPTERSEEHA
jgi:hypothetical protein